MAPHLIREITRRVNMTGIFQAVYTAGIVLPKPVASCRYYHRSLDPLKLIAIRFSPRPKGNVTNSMIQKKYKLPAEPQTPGVRPLQPKDVGKACALLQNYLKQFHISAHFDEQEFAYWFLPRDGVINTYVVEDPKTKQVTDLMSFYTLPSSIIGHQKYRILKAAYSFYNVHTKTDIVDLMRDNLILARQLKFDVFNALDIFHNEQFLEPLKFGKGDGHLQYYFYNWKCPPTKPTNMGLVLM
jgi:glycylpeptide N-tetradecanoyltransferase